MPRRACAHKVGQVRGEHVNLSNRARGFVAASISGLLAVIAIVGGPVAAANAAEPDTIYSLVNQARSAVGVQPLLRNAALDQVAVNWANQMAAANSMTHNPYMSSQIPAGWSRAGENVARGQADGTAVHVAWMNSPGHKANILGDYTDIGIAFVRAGGTTWSVEVFAKYAGHVTAPPVSAGAASFVKALYADVLNRTAGDVEVGFWGRQLMTGGTTTAVASGFVNSDEYRLIRIRDAYRTDLGREGESAGVNNWLDLMKRGILETDDVDKYFMASDEYTLRSGGTTESFVAAMYQQMLGRPVTPSEIPFWVSIAHTSGRLSVVDGIWHSVESARSRVTDMYSAYLGRVPDEPGVASWANIAIAGGDAAVRWQIIGSAEYWARAGSRFPA
jgi:Cysteine-rich secretory protein family/Domain of unknown function (DUF4214)